MDSASQLLLGAAVSVAVMGRRTAIWKAALWGGIAGTLPDLDVFLNYGDAIRNMTFHRAESHALFWQTLFSPLLAALAARLHGDLNQFRRWWLALWLALVTHPLLDAMTVYGTQLLLPFTDFPVAVGSVFIIDPLYTLPLLVGVIAALIARSPKGLRWNAAGLVLSTLYLAWGAGMQHHVTQLARDSLPAETRDSARILVTPTPFNSILWRVLVRYPDHYEEGFYSLLDQERRIRFERFPHDVALDAALRDQWSVARMAWFSKGFYQLKDVRGQARLADLRMGVEPYYTFVFVVAERKGDTWAPVTPVAVGDRGDIGAALRWVWTRLLGNDIPPPR